MPAAMSFDPFADRIDAILGVPAETLDYERWLKDQRSSAPGERDYLFAEERARFEPRKDDVVVALPGLEVREQGGAARVRCATPALDVQVPGVRRREVERILGAIDGERCLLEVRWAAGVEQEVLGRFLRATFGALVLAPGAVQRLESALSGVEVTRFPGSPYGIERPYWHNMIDVREHWLTREGAAREAASFLRLLRELHVLALMGRGLDSFYKPASPGSDRRVAPGALLLESPRLARGSSETIFFDGPRVNASLLGGEGYLRELFSSLGDESALDGERGHAEDGLPWGSIVTARSERDDQAKPWFCPPRPLQQEHIDQMRARGAEARDAASRGQSDVEVRALARFHQAFVRLHPFRCANQCLAMNLVNAALARSRGAGIPHLVLDQLALRLEPRAYEEAFRRAVAAWTLGGVGPSERLATLMERKRRWFAAVERVSAARSPEQRRDEIARDPQAARWALLEP
jgi:hypothetical protein